MDWRRKWSYRSFWIQMLGVLLVGLLASVKAETKIRLVDVTVSTGISFQHFDGSSGRYYLPETMSGGLALFDYDNDGDIDIYLLNGAPQPGTRVKKRPTNAHLSQRGQLAICRRDERVGSWRFRTRPWGRRRRLRQ